MRSQFLGDMLDMATAPRQVAQGDRAGEKLESITDDTQNCWGNAHRSGPMGPMNKGLTNWSNISQSIAWWTAGNSNSARVSSSIDFRKKLSFLTAIHDTAWNTFVADVQVLRSRGCRDLSTNWITCHLKLKQRHLCNLQILRGLPRQAKPPLYGGWHGTWNKCHWPWNVKWTISWIGPWVANRLVVQLSSEYLQGWQLLWGEPWGFCKITQQTPSSARLAGSIPKVH